MNKTIRPALLAPAAALVLLVAGCGDTIDNADLEDQLRTDLSQDAGVDPAGVSVSCPSDEKAEKGNAFDCTLTAPNGDEVTVNVTITDDDGSFEAKVPPQQFDE
jgi:hypothetical protein